MIDLQTVMRSKGFYVVAGVIGLLVHLEFGLSLYGFSARVLCWLFLAVFLRFLFIFSQNPRESSPLLLLIAFEYYLGFGAAQFSQDFMEMAYGPYEPDASVVLLALVLALISEAVIFLFAAGRSAGSTARAATNFYSLFPDAELLGSRQVLFYTLVVAVVTTVTTLRSDAVPANIRHFVDVVFQPYLVIPLLLFLGYRRNSRLLRWTAMVFTVYIALFGLVRGMLSEIIGPLYVFAMGHAAFGRRGINYRWVTAGIVIFAVLQPVKGNYRELTWNAADWNTVEAIGGFGGAVDRLGYWVPAFEKFLADPFASEQAVSATTRRFSGLLQLAHMIDWVPSRIPYKHGEGFSSTLASFVPRFLWPGKPLSTVLYDRYAIDFGYADWSQVTSTTTGLLMVEEGYWDFGYVGVLLYAAIFGLTIKVLFHNSKANATRSVITLSFSAAIFQCLYALTIFIASLFSFFVGVWVALKLLELASGWRRPSVMTAEAVVGSAA